MEENIKTKEAAKEWIEQGKPCTYTRGWAWKGAGGRKLSKEEALKMLPGYSFGKGFYELDYVTLKDGTTALDFNELDENDMW